MDKEGAEKDEKEAFFSCLEELEPEGDEESSEYSSSRDEEPTSDTDNERQSSSLAELCLSPPKNVRKIKRDKSKIRSKGPKIHRSKSKSRLKPRPLLINSAEHLGTSEEQVLKNSISDHLNELQDQLHKESTLKGGYGASNSASAPPTASILATSAPSFIKQMESSSSNRSKKNSMDPHHIDPFDRAETQKKVS